MNLYARVFCFFLPVWIVFLLFPSAEAQIFLKPDCYLVSFTDKEGSPYHTEAPEAFLSRRAVARKNRLGVPIDRRDLPVSPVYLDSLEHMGFRVLFTSRWMNSAVIQVAPQMSPDKLSSCSFIDRITPQYPGTGNGTGMLAVRRKPASAIPGKFILNEMNAFWLHEEGFKGRSMWIAVLDGGFYHVDRLAAFDPLREEGRLIAFRDFIVPDGDVFLEDSHGMQVFSVMAGSADGSLTGTAPEASYILLRSEEIGQPSDSNPPESWFEEEAWISAVEFADSIGVDVVSSSLGYNVFNDTTQNHSLQDLNGKTLRIARAANYAVEKGMLVIVSAGNEGNKSRNHIMTPGDAVDALTVGSVNIEGEPSGFSSRGSVLMGRVKPDVSALGENVPVLDESGALTAAAGTSFATPLIAGLAACLWEKFPQFSPSKIMDAIRGSASNSLAPDTLKGYGIPNFKKAADILSAFNDSL